MSLTSILDTARKLGIPVVITNDRGEAPQVVMPFEDFASMVGVNLQKERKPRLTSIPKTKDEVVQALEDLKEEGRIPDEEMFDVSSEEIVNLPPEADRLLEDHFYFEPLDDKETP